VTKRKRTSGAKIATINGQNGSEHSRPVRPDKTTLNIAICGLGRAAMGLLNREVLAMKEVRIVGSYDLLHDRAEALSHRLECKVYHSYAEMLADPEVELVVVATRSIEHAPMAIQALKAGKNVLVEKPMGINLREADRLLKVAKTSRGKLFVRHNRRFDPPFLQVKEIIASRKLGDVYQIALRVHKYQKRNDWQTLKRFGGGQLLNWGPHVIDWGLQLLGCPVTQMWSDLKCVAAAGDAEDTVKMLLRGENDVVIDIEISDAIALGQPAWVVYGSRGTLAIHGTTCSMRYLDPKLKVKVKADAGTPSITGGYAGPAKLQWIDETFEVAPKYPTKYFLELYKTLKRGREFPVTLEQARETMRIIELARKGTRFA
jgi:scyllo-inositol 2-dehydrogenase (NADP+)